LEAVRWEGVEVLERMEEVTEVISINRKVALSMASMSLINK